MSKMKIIDFDLYAFIKANGWLKNYLDEKHISLTTYLGAEGYEKIKKGDIPFHYRFENYNEEKYFEFYPRLKDDIQNGYFEDGFDHFCKYGYKDILEGRTKWKKKKDLNRFYIEGFDIESFIEANADKNILSGKKDRKRVKSFLLMEGRKKLENGDLYFHPQLEAYNDETYCSLYPKVLEDVKTGYFATPFEHFCLYGYSDIMEGRRYWPEREKSTTVQKVTRGNDKEKNFSEIEINTLFFPDWYKIKYKIDLDREEVLWIHFLEDGYLKGYNPNPLFNTKWYSKQYMKKNDKTNPLIHYTDGGWEKDFSPSYLFDGKRYRENYSISDNPLTHYLYVGRKKGNQAFRYDYGREEIGLIIDSGLFDCHWYSERYKIDQQIDPIVHYVNVGWKKGLEPNGFFDSEYYRKTYGIGKDENPLLHYIKIGKKKGYTVSRIDAVRKACFDDTEMIKNMEE